MLHLCLAIVIYEKYPSNHQQDKTYMRYDCAPPRLANNYIQHFLFAPHTLGVCDLTSEGVVTWRNISVHSASIRRYILCPQSVEPIQLVTITIHIGADVVQRRKLKPNMVLIIFQPQLIVTIYLLLQQHSAVNSLSDLYDLVIERKRFHIDLWRGHILR